MGIKSAVGLWDVEDSDFAPRDADGLIPGEAIGEPFIKPDFALGGADKEFYFHLFEFTGTEGEVPRIDLVAKGFTDLGDAEGKFLARDFQDILELDEHGLGGFGAEVGKVTFVFHGADVGFEHKVKLARLGELTSAGVD